MMKEFVRQVASGAPRSRTSAAASVESHLIALAAEESRRLGGQLVTL